jgi:hypothetical protein
MQLRVTISYEINTDLIVSPAEMQMLYFYGVTILDRSGQALSKEAWKHYVKASQEAWEHEFGIKFVKQIIEETVDFNRDEYRNWGYLEVTYPVVRPFRTTGMLGNVRQLDYPEGWLSSKRTTEGAGFWRRIFVVPAQTTEPTTGGGNSILYSGVLPWTSMTSFKFIPNYWSCVYCTGFDRVPRDLLDIVGKSAAISIFDIAGDIALGQAALASYSLSIDGLSQSIGTTNSATNAAFGARIINYQKEIKTQADQVRTFYKGISCTSM